MRMESIILDKEKTNINSSIWMVLPLSKGDNVIGVWLLSSGGGVLLPRVASTGGQWRHPMYNSRQKGLMQVL